MFKKNYTKEDIAEIADWFRRHRAELPATLQLNAATFYKDLPDTVKTYFEVYEMFGDVPTFSGQYHQLYLIRKKLEEDGIKD